MSGNLPETLSEALKRIAELESQVAQLKPTADICNGDLTYTSQVAALYGLRRLVDFNCTTGQEEQNRTLRLTDKPCDECGGFHITR